VLSTLRRHALPCVALNDEARDRLEDALADAQQIATTMLVQAAVASTRVSLMRSRHLARVVEQAMFESPAAVSRALGEYLPALGVEACVVAALLPGEPGFLGRVRFGFGPGKGHPEQEALPLTRLPEHPLVEASRTLFLLPLVLGEEPLGVAAFSVTSQLAKSELLEDLRELLSIVLKVTQTTHD
jgi:hypothetical protein